MRNPAMPRLRAFVTAALVVVAVPAFAIAQRTFVASTGNDANPCSITAPCRAFAAAVSKTSAAGEVIVQDSAGYGPVIITQSVSIIAPPGIYGGISVFSGNGITITGSGIEVVLRGLTINGQGGSTGIAFTQGLRLTVEDCEISHMSVNGIDASATGSRVTVRNTVLRDNDFGFQASGSLNAVLDRVHAANNGFYGIRAGGGSRVTVTDSVLANNVSVGVFVEALGGAVTDVMVTHSTIAGSPYGFYVGANTGSASRLVSDGNAINNTGIAAFFFSGGGGTETIYTSGNNTVGFNNGIVVGGSLTPIGQY